MGLRGPAPKPAALKLLAAPARKKRDGKKQPPEPPEPPPLPPAPIGAPEYLKGNARFEWDRLAPDLIKTNRLTVGDISVFAAYCEAFGTWRQYEGQCEEVGPQMAVQMGYRNAADRAVERMAKLGARFGLDLASRAAIKIPGVAPEKENSSKERFFGGVVPGGKA